MKVLLAQFRKPPTETRFFDRIGPVFTAGGWKVISAGAAIPSEPPATKDSDSGLLAAFRRPETFPEMLRNLLRLLDLTARISPDVMVVCNPESSLLLPLLRLRFPQMKIVFDVQENHSLNLREQLTGKKASKLLASGTGFLLWAGLKSSHRIWLAERIYCSQLELKTGTFSIFENRPPAVSFPRAAEIDPFEFCFTGYISRESGILTAIEFVRSVRKQMKDCRLMIYGYCPDTELAEEICSNAFVSFHQPGEWKNAETISRGMSRSAALLMCYRESSANAGKTPSKWFQARALGLPVLFPADTALCLPGMNETGYAVNFQHPDPDFAEKWPLFLEQRVNPFIPPDAWFDAGHLKEEILRLRPSRLAS